MLCFLLGTAYAMERDFSISLDMGQSNPLEAALQEGAEAAYEVNYHGLTLLDKRDLDSAKVYFDSARAMLPFYADAENNYALVQYRKGEIETPRRIWQSIIYHDSTYARAHYNLGLLAFEQEEYHRAHDFLRRAVRHQDDLAHAHALLGQVRQKLGHPQAVQSFERAVQIDPSDSSFAEQYVFSLLAQEDTSSAKDVLRRDERAWARALRGKLLVKQGRGATGRMLLEPLWNEGDTTIVPYLVEAYIQDEAFEEVVALYQEKAHLFTSDLLPSLFYAKYSLGDFDGAVQLKHLDGIQSKDDALLRINTAQIYYERGQTGRAVEVLSGVPSAYHGGFYWRVHGAVMFQRGKFEQAERSFLRALETSDEPPADIYTYLGLLYVQTGLKDRALIQFEKALALNPDDIDAAFESAILREEGFSRVRELLEERLSTGQAHRADSLRLAYLLHRDGPSARARALTAGYEATTPQEFYLFHQLCQDYASQDALQYCLERHNPFSYLSAQQMRDFLRRLNQAGEYAVATSFGERERSLQHRGDWEIYYILGYSWFRRGGYGTARAYLRRAHEKNPEDLYTAFLLSALMEKHSDNEAAEFVWQSFIPTDKHVEEMATVQQYLLRYNREDTLSTQARQTLRDLSHDAVVDVGRLYLDFGDTARVYDMAFLSIHTGAPVEELLSTAFFAARAQNDTAVVHRLMDATSPGLLAYERGVYYLSQGAYEQARMAVQDLPDTSAGKARVKMQSYLLHGARGTAAQYLDSLRAQGVESLPVEELEALLSEAFIIESDTTVITPEDSTLLYQHIQSMEKQGECTRVIHLVRAYLSFFEEKDLLSVLRRAGACARADSQWKDAHTFYMRAFRESDAAKDAYYASRACYFLQDHACVKHYYDAALMRDSTLHDSTLESATHIAEGAESLPVDTLLGRLHDFPLDTLYNRAVSFHRRGNISEAVTVYEAITQRDSSFVRAWNNLGVIAADRGEVSKALTFYTKALTKGRGRSEAYKNIVELYLSLNDHDQARMWLKEGLKAYPSDFFLRRLQHNLKKN
ncbi:tetratricopeptide repeat protein [Chitinivibrio alkaliphilus]|uniref:tetratricopeptide repeat protein n=1 Tax=Chitinivibrio alkaliphilus TaxID=1505232 RepID=UPI0004272246|nr:tetratricopeptide repeat protein [Chitinivibrio alkaliphilus]